MARTRSRTPAAAPAGPVTTAELVRLADRAVQWGDDPAQKDLGAILAIVARLALIEDEARRRALLHGLAANLVRTVGPHLVRPPQGG